MRRCLYLTALALVAMSGCSTTGKKNATAARNPANSGSGAAPAAVARIDTPTLPSAAPSGEPDSSIVAGQVIDSAGRPAPNASIRVVMVTDDEPGKPAKAPIEMQAHPDKDGYFIIQNLKKDRDYALIVTAKDGEAASAQIAVATPPNPRLRIQLDESIAKNMPDTAALLQQIRKRHAPSSRGEVPTASLENPQVPTGNPLSSGRSQGWDVQIDTPLPNHEAAPSGPAPGSPRPAGYVAGPSNWPPAAEFKWQPPSGPREPNDNLPFREPKDLQPPLPTPPNLGSSIKLPACDLVGDQLRSFTVRDLSGQMYDFERDQHPRLVLLQFWHTTCPPCLHSIPFMKQLQTNYGKYGLEIIGICYEDVAVVDQIRRVEAVAARGSVHGFNYPILLGGDSRSCPLHTKLHVVAHPTFFLLDPSGRIVYHEEGFNAQSVERAIRNSLGLR